MIATNEELALLEKWKRKLCLQEWRICLKTNLRPEEMTIDDLARALTEGDSQEFDFTPVVHGRWIRPHWKNSNYCCDCSECGGEAMHRDYQWDKNGIYPICPHCGAKMDGRGQ